MDWLDAAFDLESFDEENNRSFLTFSSEYKPEVLLPENFLICLPDSHLPPVPTNVSEHDLSSSCDRMEVAADSEDPIFIPASRDNSSTELQQQPAAAVTRKLAAPRSSSGRVRLATEVELPASLRGLPVIEVEGELVVFISHLLARVLKCQCRARRHFGLFKDKKFGQFRRSIDCSSLKHSLHDEPSYLGYRERYPVNRLKNTAAAITVEGLLKWSEFKMGLFVAREENKCLKGCVKAECTCSQTHKQQEDMMY